MRDGLVNETMELFCYVDPRRVPDGYGGTTTIWVDGAEFKAALAPNTSTPAQIAQAQGVHEVYRISTKKSVLLMRQNVIRRLRDGKIFRITSDGDENQTPESARLNMRQVTAEEWELPA